MITESDLDRIEATVLGAGGTVYGDDVLALVAEVRRLRDGIVAHCDHHSRDVGLSESSERDEALWSLLDDTQARRR